MLKPLYNAFFSLLYPAKCRLCSGLVENIADGAVCEVCWEKAPFFSGAETLCSKCGTPVRGSMPPANCPECAEHTYDSARAAGKYRGALAAEVLSLKSRPLLSRRSAKALEAAYARSCLNGISLIVPVPLSKRRRLERGFNQAEVLADRIAASAGIPMDAVSLARKVHTPMHRAAMDRRARELTVQNAFEVKRPKLIANRSILLVDDVLTSGATASACAAVLKKNGASEVHVLTLARAVSDLS